MAPPSTSTGAAPAGATALAKHDLFALRPGQAPLAITGHTAPPIRGTEVDDVSRMNKTRVAKVFRPTTAEELRSALAFAREKGLKVAMAGARHSMGGQAMFQDAVLLDMTGLKRMSLGDPAKGEGKTLRVQAGAMWDDVQEYLDERGLSVDVMQTPNMFTVGGTLSANAHGSNPNSGPISTTVESLRLMTPDGEIKQCSRTENPELFRSALGGYGLFGVIIDADIKVRDNEMYKLDHRVLKVDDFPKYFREQIENNGEVGYFHALFDISPGKGFIRDLAIYKYTKDRGHQGPLPKLKDDWMRPVREVLAHAAYAMATSLPLSKEIYWQLLSKGLPEVAPKASRNELMHEAFEGFRMDFGNHTQIFQEYFIPKERVVEFVNQMRQIYLKYDADPAMAALRSVKKEDMPVMSYAPQDVFGVVMCLKHDINDKNNAKLTAMTRELVDAAQKLGGRHYLPYQLAYSDEQLRKAYPETDEFLKLKQKYDPGEMFMNKWYAKYGDPKPAAAAEPAPLFAPPALPPPQPETTTWF